MRNLSWITVDMYLYKEKKGFRFGKENIIAYWCNRDAILRYFHNNAEQINYQVYMISKSILEGLIKELKQSQKEQELIPELKEILNNFDEDKEEMRFMWKSKLY